MTEAIPAFKDMLERRRHRSASSTATEADARSDAQPHEGILAPAKKMQRRPPAGRKPWACHYLMPCRAPGSPGATVRGMRNSCSHRQRRAPATQPFSWLKQSVFAGAALSGSAIGRVGEYAGCIAAGNWADGGSTRHFRDDVDALQFCCQQGSIPGSAGIEASPARAAKIASSPAPQIIAIEWRSRHISLPTAPMCNHSRGDDLHPTERL